MGGGGRTRPASPHLCADLPARRCRLLLPPAFLPPQGGYDHYMQKEIHEQPESIYQTMRGRVSMTPPSPQVCPCCTVLRCIALHALCVRALRSVLPRCCTPLEARNLLVLLLLRLVGTGS